MKEKLDDEHDHDDNDDDDYGDDDDDDDDDDYDDHDEKKKLNEKEGKALHCCSSLIFHRLCSSLCRIQPGG